MTATPIGRTLAAPCPWGGGKHGHVEHVAEDPPTWAVWCSRCCARGPHGWTGPESAVEQWNKRGGD